MDIIDFSGFWSITDYHCAATSDDRIYIVPFELRFETALDDDRVETPTRSTSEKILQARCKAYNMTISYEKDPQATLDYGNDWAIWLGSDSILSSAWSVDAGITVVSSSFTATTTTIWLSGGTLGSIYNAVNHIETVCGRKEDRTLTIVMVSR